MAALQTMISHSISSSSLCHSSSVQQHPHLYRSNMAASDISHAHECSSARGLSSSGSVRNSSSSAKRHASSITRSAHEALFHRPQVSPATGCCISSGSEPNNGYEYGHRSTTSTTGYHPNHPSYGSEDVTSTAWNRLVADGGGPNETSQIKKNNLSDAGNSLMNSVRYHHQQLLVRKKNQPICGFTARGLEGHGRPDVVIGSAAFAQPLSSHVDCFSWSPVNDWRRVSCGLVTSSTGRLPKLTRAVSEFSLYGQRCAGEQNPDDEDSLCRRDVIWCNAKEEGSPPRLAPISGQLSKVASQVVIRPVPHRAIPLESVTSSSRRVSGPPDIGRSCSTPTNGTRLSTDDGYSSSSRSYVTGLLGNHSSSSDEASNSATGFIADVATVGGDCDDSVRLTRSQQDGDRLRRQSSSGVLGTVEKATISDVGWRQQRSSTATAMIINELEAELRGKEAELRRLRVTMETNETAIVDVLQERRRSWQAQMTALSAEWERKLRSEQQKTFRNEQSLLLQVCRLQQDNRDLMLQKAERRPTDSGIDEDGTTDRRRSIYDQNGNDSDELRAARSRLDEMRWELDEKIGEVAALSDRLTAAESRSCDLDAKLAASRQQIEDEFERASAAERDRDTASETVESLRVELQRIKAMSEREKIEFEFEREQWLDEKRRVIEYQKQLQLNYVQMARKNRVLESDIQQLAANIERKTTTRESGFTTAGAFGNHPRHRPSRVSPDIMTNAIDVDESMC